MKALKIILVVVLAIAIVGTIILATLDGKYNVSRSVFIDATPEIIYAEVSDFKTWPNWSVWFEKDTAMSVSFGDITQGEGATYSWVSETEGSGNMRIIEAVPNTSVKTQINFDGMGSSNGSWTFTPKDDGTEVTWGFSGEMPFLFRFLAAQMDDAIGPDFEKGLLNLKTVIEERKPKFTFTRMDLKPTAMYYTTHQMSISASMSDVFYENAIKTITDYLGEDMANVTGALQSIYTYWDEANDSTVFNLGIPCYSNKPGNDIVKKGNTYEGACVKLVHYGSYVDLKEAHEAMMEYFASNNLKMGKVVFEVFVVGPSQSSDASTWETELYYAIDEA